MVPNICFKGEMNNKGGKNHEKKNNYVDNSHYFDVFNTINYWQI